MVQLSISLGNLSVSLRNAVVGSALTFACFSAAYGQSVKDVATIPVGVVDVAKDQEIAGARVVNGIRVMEISSSPKSLPLEVATGTLIYLRYRSTTGALSYRIDPPGGVLESPPGRYHLPRGVIGILRAVGPGSATISIKESQYEAFRTSNGPAPAGCDGCWSGYVIGGGPFAFVQGQWRVPTIEEQGGSQDSAVWIGIDGFGVNSLIQVGTDQSYDCCIFGPSYSAWYQVLPADQYSIGIGNPVAPGDLMMAWISALDADGQPTFVPPAPDTPAQWLITLNNLTQHWVFHKTVTFSGSMSTAEWIVEGPTNCGLSGCSVSRIADYGSVTFDIMDNVCPPPGGVGACTSSSSQSPNFNAAQRLTIAQPGQNGWTYFSTPSVPDGDQDGFTVQYSAPSQIMPNPPGPIVLPSMPNAVLNQAYSQSIGFLQDAAPIWQQNGGSLPPGLALSSSGVVSGTPTVAGAFTFSVLLTDGINPGASATQQVTLNVLQIPPPPDFALTASPIRQRPKGAGCVGSTTMNVVSINGFSGDVMLTADPNSVLTAAFSPNPATTADPITLAVAAPFCDGWPGSLKISGTDGSLAHSINVGIIAPQCGKPGFPPCRP